MTALDPRQPGTFASFFMGGFECSTHRRADGRRLDLAAGTRHDVLVRQDYAQLLEHGIRVARDGVRWHLIERTPGQYDWSSVLPGLGAARELGLQVIWDLCHYGWPDGLDVFSAAFVDRFAGFAGAFAALHLAETGLPPAICPVNEVSFFAWAGADAGLMAPGLTSGSRELKRQMVRAALAGTAAAHARAPGTCVLAIDPVTNIVPRPGQDPAEALAHDDLQWQAWDMLLGRQAPELGGGPGAVNVLGVNYYWNNQWLHGGVREPVLPGDPGHVPLRTLLARAYARYRLPMIMAETSIEGDERAPWLRTMCEEVRAAMTAGVPIGGICWYPVLSHPGWDDDRYCANGLFELEHGGDRRPVHGPLAAELERQRMLFEGPRDDLFNTDQRRG